MHFKSSPPASITRGARRWAIACSGGVAVFFAAHEPLLDFMPYRQDSDFYYLTGWTEPGAALMVIGADGASQPYREILFLPARDLRMEKYTGVENGCVHAGRRRGGRRRCR